MFTRIRRNKSALRVIQLWWWPGHGILELAKRRQKLRFVSGQKSDQCYLSSLSRFSKKTMRQWSFPGFKFDTTTWRKTFALSWLRTKNSTVLVLAQDLRLAPIVKISAAQERSRFGVIFESFLKTFRKLFKRVFRKVFCRIFKKCSYFFSVLHYRRFWVHFSIWRWDWSWQAHFRRRWCFVSLIGRKGQNFHRSKG